MAGVVSSLESRAQATPPSAPTAPTQAAPAAHLDTATDVAPAAPPVTPAPAPQPLAPRSYQLEFGPSLAFVARQAPSSNSSVHYDATLAPGLDIRISLLPWLRTSARYLRALHDVTFAPGALATSARALSSEAVHMTTLDLTLHPVVDVSPRLHLMGTAGVGWASVVARPVALDPPSGPTLRLRKGVFLESLVGLGLVVDLVPSWVTLSYEAIYAPTFGASGDVFATDPFVDASGQHATVGPFPAPRASYYHRATLALSL